MALLLFLFMVMAFAEILKNKWSRQRLDVIKLKQNMNSQCDTGKLTVHNRKYFSYGGLLHLFCIYYIDNGIFNFENRDQMVKSLDLTYYHFTKYGLEMHRRGSKVSKTPRYFGCNVVAADTREKNQALTIK